MKKKRLGALMRLGSISFFVEKLRPLKCLPPPNIFHEIKEEGVFFIPVSMLILG